MTKGVNDYNRLASVYDLLTSTLFAGRVDKAQFAFMGYLPENGRIIWLGGGTGRQINRLFEVAKPMELWYIDKSEKMVEKARRNCKKEYHRNIRFICGTQKDLPSDMKFDAAITFFFFDQFERVELIRIFIKIHQTLRPGAIWLWADFVQPVGWWQSCLMKMMFLFFSITTGLKTRRVFDLPHLFRRKGYQQMDSASFFGEFIRSIPFKEQSELQ